MSTFEIIRTTLLFITIVGAGAFVIAAAVVWLAKDDIKKELDDER